MPEARPVRLLETLRPGHFLALPPQEDRASVVRSLVRLLADAGAVGAGRVPALLRLVGEREKLGSTALGGGLAVPHARVSLPEAAVAAAVLRGSSEGWNPLDGTPVRVVFLLLSPKADDACHAGLLGEISALGRQAHRVKALGGCRTPEEFSGALRGFVQAAPGI